MRVLVVDPDDSFCSEALSALEGAGFSAVAAGTPDQVWAQFRASDFGAVLIDLSLKRMNGFDLARELRVAHAARSVEIVLMSPRHKRDSHEIVSLMRDTEARYFFNTPLDFSALVSALKTPQEFTKPQAPESLGAKPKVKAPVGGARLATNGVNPRPKKRRINWENTRMMAEVWAGKATGTLRLEGDKSGGVSIVAGGLVDDAGVTLVKAALVGGTVSFEEAAMPGLGDWARFGRLLFKGARAGSDARRLRRYLTAVPTPTATMELARVLPLSDLARRFVARINGVLKVSEILELESLPVGEVSRDILAVLRLGMLKFCREDSDAQTPSAKVVAQKFSPAAQAPPATESEQLFVRLEREFATICDALPPVVLGIPADSKRAFVDRAGARMRQRYAEILARRDITEEVMSIALEIAKRVDSAHRNFNFKAQSSTGVGRVTSTYVDDVEVLLAQGRELIRQKQWSKADATLAAAHKRRIDHVPVLANLGWARIHNPEVESETRTDEGRDYLLLAEQFDSSDSDGQYYLAQVLVASNRLEAAGERAKRALAAAPDDAARQTLVRKIKVLLAKAGA